MNVPPAQSSIAESDVKILIPIIGFGKSGGYRVLGELATRWIKQGCTVHFLVHERLAEPYFPTAAKALVVDRRGRVRDSAERRTGAIEEPLPPAADIYWRMLRGLQKVGVDYDVILANHSLTAYPVAIARTKRARKFYYVQAYEPEYYRVRRGYKNVLLSEISRISYRLPLTQIANAPIYIGYKDIRAQSWVPPGIDERVFYRRTEPPKFAPHDPWTIGTIGRHEKDKGTIFVLEAFRRVASADRSVHLRTAFGNLPSGWCHERASTVIPGDDHALAEFYRTVDVLVAVPTQQFGACHYPVLEAMACGTPVISTGHMPAKQSNSWIVPPGDPAAIVRALEEIRRASCESVFAKLDLAAESTKSYRWDAVSKEFLHLLQVGGG